MKGDHERLEMLRFLIAVKIFETYAREFLLMWGYHPKVIYTKALKAAEKDYTEYGTVADRPWLTEKGRKFLRERGIDA